MMRATIRRSVLPTIVLLLAAGACTSGGDRAERTNEPNAASLQGGTLRVAVPDDGGVAVDLDPQAYWNQSCELARCCLLRTLYSYSGKPPEEGGAEVRPDLAEGMPDVSSDGLTWTFRLKRGLRYAPPLGDTPIVALPALDRIVLAQGPE
jgi:peptide/nickel transport system substrate-binding protein